MQPHARSFTLPSDLQLQASVVNEAVCVCVVVVRRCSPANHHPRLPLLVVSRRELMVLPVFNVLVVEQLRVLLDISHVEPTSPLSKY